MTARSRKDSRGIQQRDKVENIEKSTFCGLLWCNRLSPVFLTLNFKEHNSIVSSK